PREENKVIGTIDITNGATATSGDYERFFIKDGVRYHHIIDPKTGFPAAKVQSVTIVAKDGTTADAVSTAVFVMGKEEGMKLIEKLPDAEGLIIDADGNITMSSGFNEYNPSIPKEGVK
ncbi:MAG TPA: FAD:protein FMN transferase, partial [Syntrophales bacterium]|nr:FAD:protein FMN transferase [Syntrophales bacterium]